MLILALQGTPLFFSFGLFFILYCLGLFCHFKETSKNGHHGSLCRREPAAHPGSEWASLVTPRAAQYPLFPALSSAQRKNSSYDDGFTNVPNSSSITSTINRPGSRIPHIPLLAIWRLMGQILCVINLLESNPGERFYIAVFCHLCSTQVRQKLVNRTVNTLFLVSNT